MNCLGETLTWEGRTLTSYEDETNIIEYEYDENGMRYRTTVTSKTDGVIGSYEYVWVDGKLISIVCVSGDSTETAKYLYNDRDEPVGMVLTDADGTLSTYYYLKNLQGDITHIVSASGKKLIEFTYDVFGKQTVHYQANGSTIIGMIELVEQVMARALTPFGYRGYCYDSYTGLYYLQSRYYDPETGRFINADDTNYLNATGTVLSCNLFAYCENDPVNRVDPKGTFFIYIDLYYTKFDVNLYLVTAKMSQKNKYGKVTRVSPIFVFENNIISVSNQTVAMASVINKKWTYYLAYGIYYASKRISKYSLLGRTVEGIQFELLVHYILYIGLKDVKNRSKDEEDAFLKAKTTNIGTPNKGFGYDWNAAKFEKMRYLYSSFETKLFSNKYTGYALAKTIIKLGLMK